jgi:hypothetical protein
MIRCAKEGFDNDFLREWYGTADSVCPCGW